MEAKFQVGEMVKICDAARDLDGSYLYGMPKYIGKEVMIRSKLRDSSGLWYMVNGNNYAWKEDWLEKVEEEKMEIKSVFDIPIGAVITCVNRESYINLGNSNMVEGVKFRSRPNTIVALGEDGYMLFEDKDLTRDNIRDCTDERFRIERIEKYSVGRGVNVLLGVKPFPSSWDENDIELLWQYEEPVEEMTLAEVCKALGKNIKIVKE